MPDVIARFMSGESFYKSTKNSLTMPGGHVVYDVGLKPFDCWNCGPKPAEGMDICLFCLLWIL